METERSFFIYIIFFYCFHQYYTVNVTDPCEGQKTHLQNRWNVAQRETSQNSFTEFLCDPAETKASSSPHLIQGLIVIIKERTDWHSTQTAHFLTLSMGYTLQAVVGTVLLGYTDVRDFFVLIDRKKWTEDVLKWPQTIASKLWSKHTYSK